MQTWSISPIKSLSTETRNIQFYISQIKPSMIAILGCQFDISGKRESQLRNCFYETGLWACLWSIFFLLLNDPGDSVYTNWQSGSMNLRAEAFSLPSEVTAGVKSWYTLFFLFILMLVTTSLHFSSYTKLESIQSHTLYEFNMIIS